MKLVSKLPLWLPAFLAVSALALGCGEDAGAELGDLATAGTGFGNVIDETAGTSAGTGDLGTAGTGSAGTGESGTGSAGTGESGTGSAGAGNAGTGNAGAGAAGSGAAGTGAAGTGAAGKGAAGTGAAGTGSAGTGAMPDRTPSPMNPKECPAVAPANPVGDCLGLPVYVNCKYGTYNCVCDWYHWLCAG